MDQPLLMHVWVILCNLASQQLNAKNVIQDGKRMTSPRNCDWNGILQKNAAETKTQNNEFYIET